MWRKVAVGHVASGRSSEEFYFLADESMKE